MTESKTKEILLIHGTQFSGAADESLDAPLEPSSVRGPAWYQDGHHFRTFLLERLAAEDPDSAFRVVDFRWDGANSEESRRRAGERLAEWLVEREAAKVPYHIVAHSHGGSVAWHALVHTKRHLGQLQSWTTVGTPFLTFRPKTNLWVYLSVVGSIAVFLATDPLGWRSTAQAGIVPFVQRQWVDLTAVWVNAWNGEPWAWGAVVVAGLTIILGVLLALVAIRMLIGPPLVHLACKHRRLRELRAWRRYRDLWHPLVSRQDEAIQGLKCIVDPPVQRIFHVPDLCVRHARLPVRAAMVPVRAGFWVLKTATNRAVAPVVDHAVTRRIADKLHGADLPGLRLQSVSSAPAGADQPRTLTADADQEIRAKSEEGAVRTVGALRSVITGEGNCPTDSTLGRIAGCLASMDLVHTTYFDCLEVREAITSRISTGGERPPAPDPVLGRGSGGRRTVWRTRLRACGAQVYATAAVILVFAGLHQLWTMLSTPYTKTGMAVHAIAHQPAVGDVVPDGIWKLADRHAIRRTARNWLQTMSNLGRGTEALADARGLPPTSRAWIAGVLHRVSGDGPETPEKRSTSIQCLATLERAFSLADSGGEHRHVRAVPKSVLEGAQQGALRSVESQPVGDTDLDRVLRCYEIIVATADGGSGVDRLNELAALIDGCSPDARPFAKRATAYAYALGGRHAAPEFFALIDSSLGNCSGAEDLDRTLLAGVHGLIDREPQTAAVRFEQWIEARSAALDRSDREGTLAAALGLQALEMACLDLHLLEHVDEATDFGIGEMAKKISARATDLLDRALAAGVERSPKDAVVLARASLICGWAEYLKHGSASLRSVERLREASVQAGDMGDENVDLANGIRAKAATLCAKSGRLADAKAIAKAIRDRARSQVKLQDIEIIDGLLTADSTADGVSMLVKRAQAILPEPEVEPVSESGSVALAREEAVAELSTVERVRRFLEGSYMRARIEFAHRLAQRVDDSEQRSDLLLRIAKCAERFELRPLSRRIVLECDARRQAAFWSDALGSRDD